MEKFDKNLCNLCLEITNDGNYNVLDAYTKQALDVLLLHQVVNKGDKNGTCNNCYKNLIAAYEFKVMCMKNEDSLYPYIVSAEDGLLDLKKYIEEKGEHLGAITEDHKVCRLCMQLVTSDFLCVEEVEADTIHKCIPEVNFCSTKYPVICEGCFKSLVRHSIFLKACLDTQERINCVSSGDKHEVDVKTEEVEIKTENFGDGGLNEELHKNNECDTLKAGEATEKEVPESETEQPPATEKWEVEVYKCSECSFGCLNRADLVIHKASHKNPVYKCGKCKYETKRKPYLTRHEKLHESRSEVQTFECDKCPFVTTYRSSLNTHRSRHADPSDVQTYKCNKCDYVAETTRSRFEKHQQKHRNRWVLAMDT